VARTAPAAAADVARELDVPLLWLDADLEAPAGSFRLTPESAVRADRPPAAGRDPDGLALLLHTSGTTAAPKRVPLSERQLIASASAIASSLSLGDTDRCLNVMPLFHVHGLVGALLASLVSGGSVMCCPAFDPLRIARWLDELQPTWYTAVPSIHAAVVSRRRRDATAPTSLRFIRSCSAPLTPALFADLERVFGVPVVEAYGMTEASHQIATNPLPPGKRRPGSVGRPVHADVRIVGPDRAELPAGATGEVIIRGPSVIAAYDDDPGATARSFTEGWFHTGDLGHLDHDGYLVLDGRLKEIINRAGEKVSPAEVEPVLAAHPDIEQVAVFAKPDPLLGEEVAAAVVVRAGARLDLASLRAFAARSLAPHKVPGHLTLVDEIPKGPTGKIQRRELGRLLGLS
jgi:acyl-CoA synthetase (AMP-forming)/AMP-acid ligase II